MQLADAVRVFDHESPSSSIGWKATNITINIFLHETFVLNFKSKNKYWKRQKTRIVVVWTAIQFRKR